jgi:hypothetical protein
METLIIFLIIGFVTSPIWAALIYKVFHDPNRR